MAGSGSAASSKGISLDKVLSGKGLRVGIVHTQWNTEIVSALTAAAVEELLKQGVAREDIVVQPVPGSYELPFGAKCLIESCHDESSHVDAVIAIGCLIKGDTMHMEYIAEAVTQGIMRLNLETGIPVIFGVLTVLKEEQARERAGLVPGKHNHGTEWAQSALHMAALRVKHILGGSKTPSNAFTHYL